MRKKLYIPFLIMVALTGITSCKKDYLDINTDPNNPSKVTIELLLPPILGYTAYNLGNPYQIVGGLWSQYWTQGPTSSQYINLDQYVITSTSFNRPWNDSYAGVLANCNDMISAGLAIKGDESLTADERSRGSNYAAIGKIMQAFIYQVVTDLHGDAPFSQALKGREEDGTVLNPSYDSQQNIYDGLIQLTDEGLALIDLTGSHPGADDYFYGGDMELWTKFANTLKLKIYLRQAYIREDIARQEIQGMYTAGAEFLGDGEDALVKFTNDQFNRNPLFTTMTATSAENLVASQTSINYLLATEDPRIDAFFGRASVAPNAGNHAGLLQGNGINLTGSTNSANSYSKPSPNVGGIIPIDIQSGAAAPVIITSGAESLLLQAEAAARGWSTGDAAQLYSQAIDASFAYWGFTQDDADTYKSQPAVAFPSNGPAEEKVKAIIVQKWVSMTGTENIEAWTEWRRTGYPDFFTISASNSTGNKFPARLLYPDTEVTRNPNTPAQKLITDKLWWDMNTTGQN